MSTTMSQQLAVDGGPKVRQTPFPPRRLFGQEEKAAAMRVFDEAIEKGEAFGYGGPHEQAYCEAFARYLGGGYADAVNSGSAAVWVALHALRLEPFTEVVVPPITDAGGVMPVAMLNLIPVVADSAPDSFNCGPEQIEAAITDRTSAIIITHIAGSPVDMAPVLELARKRGIKVVEDCAQAHGTRYRGQMAGTFGDVAAFSTMHGKHHATGGQGGVVFTRDEELYWQVRRASDRGKPINLPGANGNVFASLNCNSSELNGAIGQVQIAKLPSIIQRRRQTAHAIRDGIADLKSVQLDVGIEGNGNENAYWFLFFKLELDRLRVDKNAFAKAVAAEGIPVQASYTKVTCDFDWFRNRCVFGTSGLPWSHPAYQGDRNPTYDLPNIRAAEQRFFRMSLHENMGQQEVDDTVAALRKVEKAYLK